MRKTATFVGGLLGAASLAPASTAVSYTATDAPANSPDGVDQNGVATDVWTEATNSNGNLGGAGSYFSGPGGFVPNAWTLYSYPFATTGGPGGIVDETHTFTGGGLEVGQSVSMTIGISAVEAGQQVGFSLLGGSVPLTFDFTGGVNNFRYDDAGGTSQDSGLAFLYQSPIAVTYTLTSPTTYAATASDSSGSVSFGGTYAGTITGIDSFNHGAGNGSDFAFNDLAVSAAPVSVPEPMSLGLAGVLGVGMLARRRR